MRQPVWNTCVILALLWTAGCSAKADEEDSGALPALPALAPGGEADGCDTPDALSLAEFAAQAHTWFHGVIADVYPVTDLGSTYSVLNSRNREWDGEDLLLPLDQCRIINPQLRVRIQLIDSVGDDVPGELNVAVVTTELANRPTWDGPGVGGHDGFTWEGDRLAVGQHIGGHLIWSSRFEMALLKSNPATPLFLVGDEGAIVFQEFDGSFDDIDDFCIDIDVRQHLEELGGMDVTDFMRLMADLRGDGQTIDEARLDQIRLRGRNRAQHFNDDVAANFFYPICTPTDAIYAPAHRIQSIPAP